MSETTELKPLSVSGWLSKANKVIVQLALSRYSVEEAGEKLGVGPRTLTTLRYKYGWPKRKRMPSPTHEEIVELLDLLPRASIELYLLTTAPSSMESQK